jgi:hypothetical protein
MDARMLADLGPAEADVVEHRRDPIGRVCDGCIH